MNHLGESCRSFFSSFSTFSTLRRRDTDGFSCKMFSFLLLSFFPLFFLPLFFSREHYLSAHLAFYLLALRRWVSAYRVFRFRIFTRLAAALSSQRRAPTYLSRNCELRLIEVLHWPYKFRRARRANSKKSRDITLHRLLSYLGTITYYRVSLFFSILRSEGALVSKLINVQLSQYSTCVWFLFLLLMSDVLIARFIWL